MASSEEGSESDVHDRKVEINDPSYGGRHGQDDRSLGQGSCDESGLGKKLERFTFFFKIVCMKETFQLFVLTGRRC
jgi:hypothetical protein